MKERNSSSRRRPVWGVMALGVFACSAALYAKPGTDAKASQLESKGPGRIVAGSGIPPNAVLPVFPPISVDYRNDEGNVPIGGGPTAIGGSAFTVWEPSAGMSRAATECAIADDCVRCQKCVWYACEEGGKCTETALTGYYIAGCDDAQYCNGDEYCNAGTCEPGTSPCTGDDVCDEVADECYPACETPEDCDDEDDCTRDTCDVVSGLCTHEDICTAGRCCVGVYPDKECHVENLEECDTRGGRFLATADPCVVVQPSQNMNDCPKYSAGIAPQGDYVTEIGPVSWLPCDYFYEIGDDYVTQNVEGVDEGYFEVTFLRFVGGVVEPGSVRWSITFRDSNGVWIENVFWPDGQNDGGNVGVRTVDFDPPIIIPHHGYVVFRVQANFGPDGRFVVVTTDCPPDKGTNDCTVMWIDGDPHASWLGQCSGGDREGERCDGRQGNADCTGGGTCDLVPHVLAMELVGVKTTSPEGACCTTEGDCKMELPWVCKAEGSKPQGPGTLCAYCDEFSPDPGSPCTPALGECKPGTCIPIPTCETQACCNEQTGECIEVTGIGTPCPPPTVPQGYGKDCSDPHICLDEPCEHCGPGTHWVDTCYEGYDRMPTAALAAVDTDDDCKPETNLILSGPATIHRSDPMDDSVSFPGLRPVDGHLDVIDTEIVEMYLTGAGGVTLRAGGGGGAGGVLSPSLGAIAEQYPQPPGDPRYAESFFDVYFEVDIGSGQLAYNHTPLRVEQTIDCVPPDTRYIHVQDCIPLFDAPPGEPFSEWVANLVAPDHITYPAPEDLKIAACCTGNDCQVIDQARCNELDGYWLWGNVDCGTAPSCELPPDETDNPCCTGSCCVGPGECVDAGPAGEPVDKELCQAMTGEPDNYIGGAACDDDPAPCRICEIVGDANCQMPNLYDDDQSPVMSDRGFPHGVLLADDFVPTADEITTVCVWGAYLDRIDCEDQLPSCDCNDEAPDDFLVRVYNDAGGIPGTVLDESAVALVVKGPVPATFGGPGWYPYAQMYEFQLMLDYPLTGMTPGTTYWLEVSNDLGGSAAEDPTECYWHWQITNLGKNNYSAIGTNKGYVNGNERAPYRTTSQRAADASFCINVNLGDPPTPLGGCCETELVGEDYVCYDSCTTTTLQMCDGPWYRKNAGCPSPCPTVIPGDVCHVNPIVVAGDPKYTYAYNTWCTDTDGPALVNYELGMGGMGSDIWIFYYAPCEGRVTVSQCATGQRNTTYDGALAVYRDSTNPTVCPCPGDSGFTLVGTAMDENCNGIDDAGSGVVFLPPVSIGDCLTVRVGGHDAEFGPGTMKITCEGVICTPVKPPERDPSVADMGFGTRNRYISFVAKDLGGLNTGIRVTFESLPPPNDQYNGDKWFVGQPFKVTEASGSDGPVPPPTFWAATMQCGTPYYTDWSQYDTVYVYHGGIINGSTYHLQKIADDCDPGNEDSYSDPLVVDTSVFGDACGTSPSRPPQGVIDFVDISAIVAKFKNAPGAIKKSRADIIGNGPNDPYPNRKIDFVDISACVDCFRNQPPPKPGPLQRCPP